MNEEELRNELMHVPMAGIPPILSEKEAALRAKIMIQELGKLNFQLVKQKQDVPSMGLDFHYYALPGSDFGRTEHDSVHDTLKAHGFGLNWGDWVRLSKAIMLMRKHFPVSWPKETRHGFVDPKRHLATVEEILWLGLWQGVSDVIAEPRPLPASSAKGPDWCFSSCGMNINLEVKYRPGQWTRKVDSSRYSRVMAGLFEDITEKFPVEAKADELNIAAITTTAPPDRSLREETQRFLCANPNVDAIIHWSQCTESGMDPFEVHAVSKKAMVEHFFTHGDLEDRRYFGIILFPWRERDARRAKRIAESLVAA